MIQFPLFPHETRPVSNDMARSALFSCVQGVDRRMLKHAVLATVGGVEITFTGEQFNQDDHDVLMQLIFMAKNKPLGQFVMVSAYAILKGLGRKHGGHDHEQLPVFSANNPPAHARETGRKSLPGAELRVGEGVKSAH